LYIFVRRIKQNALVVAVMLFNMVSHQMMMSFVLIVIFGNLIGMQGGTHMKISTSERLENAIRHQPDRYISTRDENNDLMQVEDKDTGRLWKKVNDKGEEGWIWVE